LRRRKRRDFDRAGFMPWHSVQFVAMLGVPILAFAALHV